MPYGLRHNTLVCRRGGVSDTGSCSILPCRGAGARPSLARFDVAQVRQNQCSSGVSDSAGCGVRELAPALEGDDSGVKPPHSKQRLAGRQRTALGEGRHSALTGSADWPINGCLQGGCITLRSGTMECQPLRQQLFRRGDLPRVKPPFALQNRPARISTNLETTCSSPVRTGDRRPIRPSSGWPASGAFAGL